LLDHIIILVDVANLVDEPLDVYINMNINDISSISETKMVVTMLVSRGHIQLTMPIYGGGCIVN